MLPPGPTLPAVAQLAQWLARPIPFLNECAHKYGSAFTVDFPFWGKAVCVSEPEHVRQVFAGDPNVLHGGKANELIAPVLGPSSITVLDGPEHKRQRRLLMPPFHGERLQSHAKIIRDVTARSVKEWPVNTPFCMLDHLQKITLEVIARSVFGKDETSGMGDFLEQLRRLANTANSPWLFVKQLQWDLGPRSPWGAIREQIRVTDQMLYEEMARRRARGNLGPRHDVFSLLMQARDEAGEPMTDREIRDELMTLLVAGHETTATTLAWVVSMVLAHPHVHDRLREELAMVIGDAYPSPDHFPRLHFLDAIIKESMRLRPLFPMVARQVKAPFKVGPYVLPPGTVVMPCVHLTHRRPELYPDPEMFKPERFLHVKPDPATWYPFGGGARRCLGMTFALYEMRVILATMFHSVRVEATSRELPKVVRRGISLVPDGGARVVLTNRAEHKLHSMRPPSMRPPSMRPPSLRAPHYASVAPPAMPRIIQKTGG